MVPLFRISSTKYSCDISCTNNYDRFNSTFLLKINDLCDQLRQDFYKCDYFYLENMVNNYESNEYFDLIIKLLSEKKYINELFVKSNRPSYNLLKLSNGISLITKLEIHFDIKYVLFIYSFFENLFKNNNNILHDLTICISDENNNIINNPFYHHDIPFISMSSYNKLPKEINEINEQIYNILYESIQKSSLQKINITYNVYIVCTKNIKLNIFNENQLKNIDKLLQIPLEERN